MSENNYCYCCRFYKPYYTKGNIKFDRLDFGMCAKTEETKEKHCGCEHFSYKYFGRVERKKAALAALTENINLIAEIKQILEEDDEEALEDFFITMRERKRKRERKT